MRSVAEIQTEINQVETELEQAKSTLAAMESEIDEVAKEQATDPMWKAARLKYIQDGDMSEVNAWHNRRDQRIKAQKDEEFRQKELALQERLANASGSAATSMEAQLAEDNVELAEIKLKQAKGSALEAEAKHNYKIAKREYARTHGGKEWTGAYSEVPDGQAAEKQIETILNKKYENKKISSADKTAAINSLNTLMSQVDSNSDIWQKANTEKDRLSKLKTSEEHAADVKKLKDEKANLVSEKSRISGKKSWDQTNDDRKRLADIDKRLAELEKMGVK